MEQEESTNIDVTIKKKSLDTIGQMPITRNMLSKFWDAFKGDIIRSISGFILGSIITIAVFYSVLYSLPGKVTALGEQTDILREQVDLLKEYIKKQDTLNETTNVKLDNVDKNLDKVDTKLDELKNILITK